MWTGKTTNYFSLNIFGCPTYAMYNAQKIYILGLIDKIEGYHLWDPIDHKIVINMDIIFIK